MNEEKALLGRFDDLCRRAQDSGYYTFSDFLNMDEQSVLTSHIKNNMYKLYGGYDGAERAIAVFGDYDYDLNLPLSIVQIQPVSKKFAKELSHRDFLGSLMGLGIRREMIGDIVVFDNTGYVFCKDKITDFITESLSRVGSTDVKCTACELLPDNAVRQPEEREVIVPSLRLDAVISAVFSISRSEAVGRISSGKAFVNSKEIDSASYMLTQGDIVSLRGSGRVKIGDILHRTKKDRIVLCVFIY